MANSNTPSTNVWAQTTSNTSPHTHAWFPPPPNTSVYSPHTHTGLPGQVTHGIPVSVNKAYLARRPNAKWRQRNRLMKAMDDFVRSRSMDRRTIPVGEDEYYFVATSGADLIDALGNVNPMRTGMPIKSITMLLESVPYRYTCRSVTATMIANQGVACGLFYALDSIPGVRKKGVRLSAGGLMLLDYWATKYKKFAPFVDAYVTPKARKEITLDCTTLAFNIAPEWVVRDKERRREKIEALEKARADEVSKAANLYTAQMQLANQYSAQQYAAQRQMQASQQYQAMLQQANNHLAVTGTNTTATETHLSAQSGMGNGPDTNMTNTFSDAVRNFLPSLFGTRNT